MASQCRCGLYLNFVCAPGSVLHVRGSCFLSLVVVLAVAAVVAVVWMTMVVVVMVVGVVVVVVVVIIIIIIIKHIHHRRKLQLSTLLIFRILSVTTK